MEGRGLAGSRSLAVCSSNVRGEVVFHMYIKEFRGNPSVSVD